MTIKELKKREEIKEKIKGWGWSDLATLERMDEVEITEDCVDVWNEVGRDKDIVIVKTYANFIPIREMKYDLLYGLGTGYIKRESERFIRNAVRVLKEFREIVRDVNYDEIKVTCEIHKVAI